MSIKISIIVPVYNVEKYLERCIISILNQRFYDFELILVNDGSTDRSLDICNEYEKIDNRIKVINKENGGLSSARNAGIEVAKGEYIAFVDSDDYINRNMYQVLYDNIIKADADISISNFEYVDENDDVNLNNKLENIEFMTFNNIEAMHQLYSGNNVQFIVAWNKLYKRELFRELRYTEGRIHEDEFIIHKLLYNTNKVVYTPLRLYYYVQRIGSITQSTFNVKRLDAIYAFSERLKYFREKDLKDLEFKTQIFYLQLFFTSYYKVKSEINNCEKELKELKKDYNRNFIRILKNTYYSWNYKRICILFFVNPKLFELHKKREQMSEFIV